MLHSTNTQNKHTSRDWNRKKEPVQRRRSRRRNLREIIFAAARERIQLDSVASFPPLGGVVINRGAYGKLIPPVPADLRSRGRGGSRSGWSVGCVAA